MAIHTSDDRQGRGSRSLQDEEMDDGTVGVGVASRLRGRYSLYRCCPELAGVLGQLLLSHRRSCWPSIDSTRIMAANPSTSNGRNPSFSVLSQRDRFGRSASMLGRDFDGSAISSASSTWSGPGLPWRRLGAPNRPAVPGAGQEFVSCHRVRWPSMRWSVMPASAASRAHPLQFHASEKAH